jgi:hypothetical protein
MCWGSIATVPVIERRAIKRIRGSVIWQSPFDSLNAIFSLLLELGD